jgi:hypothetical protein
MQSRSDEADQKIQTYLTSMASITARASKFNFQADAYIQDQGKMEARYISVTNEVSARADRLAQSVGYGAADSRDSLRDLSDQASTAMTDLHDTVQAVSADFVNTIIPLSAMIDQADQSCRNARLSQIDQPSSPARVSMAKACDGLSTVEGPFRTKFSALQNELRFLEGVYQREEKKQAEIFQASN